MTCLKKMLSSNSFLTYGQTTRKRRKRVKFKEKAFSENCLGYIFPVQKCTTLCHFSKALYPNVHCTETIYL
jgi:hypothetical protein